MDLVIMGWVFVAEIALFGAIALLLPRIGRRGLLFGVYIGEAAHQGDAARALRRRWNCAIVVSTLACLAVAAPFAIAGRHPLRALVPEFLLIAIGVGLYLRCHRAAGEIARATPGGPIVPRAAASLSTPPSPTVLPWVSILAAAGCGLFVIGNAAAQFNTLPERIPIHFNAAGAPDGWSARTFGAVMVLPIMTAVVGLLLGGIALLTAHAKRVIRPGDGGVSVKAQDRFRTAMARYLSVTGLLTVGMMTSLCLYSLRAARGLAPGLPRWFLLEALLIVAWALGGVLYMVVRYGQGGARLEGAALAPLADGLADNRFWRLGVLYINRDDPSWLVERRFGMGYTLNLGNARAVATLGALLVILLALVVWAVASS